VPGRRDRVGGHRAQCAAGVRNQVRDLSAAPKDESLVQLVHQAGTECEPDCARSRTREGALTAQVSERIDEHGRERSVL
jgi:hypothetical protein